MKSRYYLQWWTIWILFLFSILPFNLSQAETGSLTHIGRTIIPLALSQALQDGMSLPIFIHLKSSQDRKDDQRIGTAFIWLDKGVLRIRQIQMEELKNGIRVSLNTYNNLINVKNKEFDSKLTIPIAQGAELILQMRQLLLQLVITPSALGTSLFSRQEELGQSSVSTVSNSLNYNVGVAANQQKNSHLSNSSFLSFDNVTALREQHFNLNGSLYGIASGQQDLQLYRAMYERDFSGRRFAAGMMDTWNLQSLAPVTALTGGKIYGFSWGNQANSIRYDNTQSITPIVAFLPSAGEVHLSREGRLLSIQNFVMGNHEINTQQLPFGIYDIQVEVIVNGRTISRQTQRVNKIYNYKSRGEGKYSWQVWGGHFRLEPWYLADGGNLDARDSWLIGGSLASNIKGVDWTASSYNYAGLSVAEARINFPLLRSFSFSQQNMLSSDNSHTSSTSLSLNLPGGFSNIWLSREKTVIGSKLRLNGSDIRSIGGGLNLSTFTTRLGNISISYNNDRFNGNSYFTADYAQNLYANQYGSLNLRLGEQYYKNMNQQAGTERYIQLDFSMPLNNWISAGISQEQGGSMANIALTRQFEQGALKSVMANLSKSISGTPTAGQQLSGNGSAQFATRYSRGSLSVTSGAEGNFSSNLTASGSMGWQGKNFAFSNRNDGNAGIILQTGLAADSHLSAKINGLLLPITGNRNFLPLEPYKHYEVELMNSQTAQESYEINKGRKSQITLYPGNVAVISPNILQMVTISGRLHAEDNSLLSKVVMYSKNGMTSTDNQGEFIIDLDKNNPLIEVHYADKKVCQVLPELKNIQGAAWLGDLTCKKYHSNEKAD